MADEHQGKSVEELRAILEAKHEKLAEVRGLRLEAEQAAADEIAAAQLRAEIDRVDNTINLEVSQLQVSLSQDPDAVGAGALFVEAQNAGIEVTDPNVGNGVKEGQTPDEVIDQQPVAPVETPAPPVPADSTPVASEGASSDDKGGKK